jgi:hypothetical protein
MCLGSFRSSSSSMANVEPWMGLQMRKLYLLKRQNRMSDAASAYVEEAAKNAAWLVEREARGPGDIENAMRRLEVKFGIPYSAFWALRYRPPKTIAVEIFARLWEAFETERAYQRKRFEDEDAATHPKTRLGEAIVRAARALAGTKDGVVNK